MIAIRRKIAFDDQRAIASEAEDLEFRIFPKWCLKRVAERTLQADPDWNKVTEQNYHQQPELCSAAKQAYSDFLDKVLAWWWRFGWSFDAIVGANFGYPIDQELFLLGKKYQFKVIIMYKEGMAIPGRWEELAKRNIGKRFWDYALFYNESIRQAATKIAFPEAIGRTKAVGIPRMDACFKIPPASDRNHLTFFAFYSPNKFGYFQEDTQVVEEAIRRGENFHRMILKAMARMPDIHLTVKTKAPTRYLDHVQKIRDDVELELGHALPNVTVTNEADPRELIVRSFAVIGFASTALIEALVAGRSVIGPEFHELFSGPSDYFQDYPGLIDSVVGEAEFKRAVDRARDLGGSRSNTNKLRNSFLSMMIHSGDGHSAREAARTIQSVIERS